MMLCEIKRPKIPVFSGFSSILYVLEEQALRPSQNLFNT